VAGDLAPDIDRTLASMTATLIVLAGAPNSPTGPSCSGPPTPRKRAWSNSCSRCATRRCLAKPISRAKLEQAFTQLFAGD
jgi:hypothetical protein